MIIPEHPTTENVKPVLDEMAYVVWVADNHGKRISYVSGVIWRAGFPAIKRESKLAGARYAFYVQ